MGDDKSDLLGQMDSEAAMSPFYRYMVHGLLPIIYLTWIFGAWYVSSHDISLINMIGAGLAHGLGLTFAINSGHETGHKTDRTSKWISLFMLAPSLYGHSGLNIIWGITPMWRHPRILRPAISAKTFGAS